MPVTWTDPRGAVLDALCAAEPPEQPAPPAAQRAHGYRVPDEVWMERAIALQSGRPRLSRECAMCGALGWCSHREDDVLVAEWERQRVQFLRKKTEAA